MRIHCMGDVVDKKGDAMSCIVCMGYDTQNCPVCGDHYEVIACPECEGRGVNMRLAFNIRTRQFVEVTPLTWQVLPSTEDRAEAMGWNYCRAEDNCPHCKGFGEVYKDRNGNITPMI